VSLLSGLDSFLSAFSILEILSVEVFSPSRSGIEFTPNGNLTGEFARLAIVEICHLPHIMVSRMGILAVGNRSQTPTKDGIRMVHKLSRFFNPPVFTLRQNPV
jgi:hypothetical protein